MPQDDLNWYPNGSSLDSSPNAWRMAPLQSGSGLSTGASSPFSGINWDNVAGAGLGVLPALFAGDRGSITPQVTDLANTAKGTLATGQGLLKSGAQTAQPALDYFKNILSGNPADVMAATAPDRKRVIDQYDTARRSAGQFTPRGGGQASTQMEARAREASDLATLGASARSNAANTAATLGLNQEELGLNAEEQATQALAQTLGPLFAQQQSDSQSTLSTIAGIAGLAAMFL